MPTAPQPPEMQQMPAVPQPPAEQQPPFTPPRPEQRNPQPDPQPIPTDPSMGTVKAAPLVVGFDMSRASEDLMYIEMKAIASTARAIDGSLIFPTEITEQIRVVKTRDYFLASMPSELCNMFIEQEQITLTLAAGGAASFGLRPAASGDMDPTRTQRIAKQAAAQERRHEAEAKREAQNAATKTLTLDLHRSMLGFVTDQHAITATALIQEMCPMQFSRVGWTHAKTDLGFPAHKILLFTTLSTNLASVDFEKIHFIRLDPRFPPAALYVPKPLCAEAGIETCCYRRECSDRDGGGRCSFLLAKKQSLGLAAPKVSRNPAAYGQHIRELRREEKASHVERRRAERDAAIAEAAKRKACRIWMMGRCSKCGPDSPAGVRCILPHTVGPSGPPTCCSTRGETCHFSEETCPYADHVPAVPDTATPPPSDDDDDEMT